MARLDMDMSADWLGEFGRLKEREIERTGNFGRFKQQIYRTSISSHIFAFFSPLFLLSLSLFSLGTILFSLSLLS